MKQQIILSALLATSALSLMAQDGDAAAPRAGRLHGGPGHRPPPFIEALDVNKDGVIDATELANASTALAKLDKNGDGQLTPDEFMGGHGPRGGKGPGPGRGPRPNAPQE
jgi:hypothetical protein